MFTLYGTKEVKTVVPADSTRLVPPRTCSSGTSNVPSLSKSTQPSSCPPEGADTVKTTAPFWKRGDIETPPSSSMPDASSPVPLNGGHASGSPSRKLPSVGPLVVCRGPFAASDVKYDSGASP